MNLTASDRVTRIVLADDHEIVRIGLAALLCSQNDMVVAGQTDSCRNAVEMIGHLHSPRGEVVDVIVIGVSLSPRDAIKAIAEIKRRWPQIQTLAFSMHDDKYTLQGLLRAGVSGCVLRRSAASEVLNAIRAIRGGATYVDPALSPMMDDMSCPNFPTCEVPAPTPLTRCEEEVLRLFSQGYTNRQIAETFCRSIKTVEAHKTRAKAKLRLEDRADLLRYAIAHGWLRNLG